MTRLSGMQMANFPFLSAALGIRKEQRSFSLGSSGRQEIMNEMTPTKWIRLLSLYIYFTYSSLGEERGGCSGRVAKGDERIITPSN